MDKHVAAAFPLYEAVTLGFVKPLHLTLHYICHSIPTLLCNCKTASYILVIIYVYYIYVKKKDTEKQGQAAPGK